MTRTVWIALALALLAAAPAGPSPADETETTDVNQPPDQDAPTAGADLRVATFNVWHGLDPVGVWRFREYETAAEREHRLTLFLEQARAVDADIWMLQEVNLLPGIAERIAGELGMDAVHQVDNCGVKVLGVGPPVNFQSGQAILARKGLGLRKVGGVKLSGAFGRCGDRFSFQLSEFRYALVAEITVGGERVLLADLHLHHGPELDDHFRAEIADLVARGHMTAAEARALKDEVRGATGRRMDELAVLLDFLTRHGWPEVPVLLGGDLNASPDSEPLRWIETLGFASSTGPWDPEAGPYTWDFERNPHTHHSLDFTLPIGADDPEAVRVLQHAFAKTRRLDYILMRHPANAWGFADSHLVCDRPDAAGVYPSDHLGIVADLRIGAAQAK